MKRTAGLAALVFNLTSIALSQIVTGAIVGSATDASGGVAPKVGIAVTNMQTGVSREMATDEAGNFSAPQLPPGVYRLTATADGFKRYEVNEITLLVDQTVRVNVHLELGAINQSVQVAAAGAQVQSETSSLGQVIDRERIVELPLNGRNYMQLATM